jgi:hypothetical protein
MATTAPQKDELASSEKSLGVITAGAGAATAFLGALGTGAAGTLVERMVRNEACLSASAFFGVEVALVLAILALAMSGRGVTWGGRWQFWLAPILLVVAIPLVMGAVVARYYNLACNYAIWLTVAVVVVITVLVVGGFIARSFWKDNSLDLGRAALHFSALFLAVSLLIITLPAILIYSSGNERPSVSAKLKTAAGTVLEATIKASGVRAAHPVRVRVDAVVKGEDNIWRKHPTIPTLYETAAGPSGSGDVDLALELPLPLGDYPAIGIFTSTKPTEQLCEQGTAVCTFVSVPPRQPRHQLYASWEGTPSQPIVVVRVVAQGLLNGGQNEEAVALQIRGRSSPIGRWEIVYSAMLRPDADGKVSSDTVKVPLSTRHTEACATAVIGTASNHADQKSSGRCGCEALVGSNGNWAWLRGRKE